jgi:hypothetical protein
MREPLALAALLVLYIPVTLSLNRLQLRVRPAARNRPGQGPVLLSGLASLAACLAAGAVLLGDSSAEKLLWTGYLGLLLACALLVFLSVMCVSESGRRFYLMHLVDRHPGMRPGALKAAYGRDHMLDVRLERLCSWKVLQRHGDRYFLAKHSAYLAARFFELWGRLLGFRWF